MLKMLAPAKINLTLEVLGTRADGYHEIRTVAQTISLFDTLEMELASDIRMESYIQGLALEANLVNQAARLLNDLSSCPQGAWIKLTKHIPEAAGLGGGSSDAAAVLIGLNRLWQLGLSAEDLFPIAARLGSDVPLFILGGTVLAQGRGELVTSLSNGINKWVVLLDPNLSQLPDKTRQLYNSLSESSFTKGEFTLKIADAVVKGDALDASLMYNVFESVAFDIFQSLNDYRQYFYDAGAKWVHLAGSGPTLYTLVDDRQKAEALYHGLIARGLKSYLAQTLPRESYSVE